MLENGNVPDECLNELAKEKITVGEGLIKEIKSSFKTLNGISKLERTISRELESLRKMQELDILKKEHLQCSNITHFAALLDTLLVVSNSTVAVNKPFMLNDRKIFVDIVCNFGLTWLKVIARNPKSLSQISMGDSSYGVRSILDQANEFILCHKLYPCYFQLPKIIFLFYNGIDDDLTNELTNLGIIVYNSRSSFESREILDQHFIHKIENVNLDVSAMLAYVSSVTNGSAGHYDFSVKVLTQQAEWEKHRPQKPILDRFFEGKTLYCCETAKTSFMDIVQTVGGPEEQSRAQILIERLITLPDDHSFTNVSNENNEIFTCNFDHIFNGNRKLIPKGKIKERALIIFNFGNRIRAVTVSANEGFIRAARQQGIEYVVFLHESRALTELKEIKLGKKL